MRPDRSLAREPMVRLVLLLVLVIFVARAFWRLVDGITEGVAGRRSSIGAPKHGVQMVRDPVCGTYVVPTRAVTMGDGHRQVFFCSTNCRDKYRGRAG